MSETLPLPSMTMWPDPPSLGVAPMDLYTAEQMRAYAAAAVAAERERCANAAESWPVAATDRPASIGVRIAAAIRAQP